MLLPSAPHNTPEGRAKLRREAELETKAALAKAKLQEEAKKRLHQQNLERNIKKLQSSLKLNVAKLNSVKRELEALKAKKKTAEEKDEDLSQEQIEIKKKLAEFDQTISKLEIDKKNVTNKLTTHQVEIQKEEATNEAKQAELAKTQKLAEEKLREVEGLKKELLDKSNLNKSNKDKVRVIQDEIKTKESVLRQKNSSVTAYGSEVKKNKVALESVREEVTALKKQLQLKEKELMDLETESRTLESKERELIQDVKRDEIDLNELRNDLRQVEFMSEQSARAVGYLERKIKDGTNNVNLLTTQSGTKSYLSTSGSGSTMRELEIYKEQVKEIEDKLEKILREKSDLEQQIKKAKFLEVNVANEVGDSVRKIRALEYEQTRLEEETEKINAEIEKLERELKLGK